MRRSFNAEQMDAIREKDVAARAKLPPVEPEKNEAKPVAYFQVDRYVKGPFRGLLVVSQLITEDGQGKPLKKPLRKTVSDGVDMVIAMSSIETALRRKVFR